MVAVFRTGKEHKEFLRNPYYTIMGFADADAARKFVTDNKIDSANLAYELEGVGLEPYQNYTGPDPEFKYEFRLLDGDDVVYYEGVATEEDFEPEDWAQAEVGCTSVQYRKIGTQNKWETL